MDKIISICFHMMLLLYISEMPNKFSISKSISGSLGVRRMHIKLYCRVNPIPGLEIDKAVTNGSAVYILLGEIFYHPQLVQHIY